MLKSKNKILFKKTTSQLFFLLVILLVYLILRNLNLHVTVADEALYSNFTRLIPFESLPVPNYLFFSIFKASTLCGGGADGYFLSCIKIFNVIFYSAATIFFFLACKKYISEKLALLASIYFALMPFNSYTAYFMPEILYLLIFWVFILFFQNRDHEKYVSSISIGFILGILSLVKPHSLFILAAYFIYLCSEFINSDKKYFYVRSFITCIATFFAIKFLFSFLVAGKSGLVIFGSNYNKVTPDFLSLSYKEYLNLITLFFQAFAYNWLSIFTIYSFPLLVLTAHIFYAKKNTKENEHLKDFRFYFILLFVLVFITSLFSASIIAFGSDMYGSISRVYFRYYSFCFPLLIFFVFGLKNYRDNLFTFNFKVILGSLFLCLFLYSFHLHLNYYQQDLVDSPDLLSLSKSRKIYLIFSLGQIFSIIFWIFKERLGCKFYSFLVFPFYIITTSAAIDQTMNIRSASDAFDRTFFYIQKNLSKQEAADVQFVTDNPGYIIRSSIYNDYIQYPEMTWIIRKQGTSITLDELSKKKIIFMIGDYKFNSGEYSLINHMTGFTELRRKE